MQKQTIRWMFAVVFAGCVPTTSDPIAREPPVLTEHECKAQDGTIVGDPGDGSTHRSDYICSSGKSPLGDIALPEEGPIAIEGAVCCPR